MATQNAINNTINGASGAVVTSTTGALSVADGGASGQVLTSAGTNTTPTFQPKPTTSKCLFSPTGLNTVQINVNSGIIYRSLTQNTTSATESFKQQVIPIAGTLKNLYVYCTGNTDTGASNTITLRVNGSSTSLVVTIPSSTTGVFSDTTHSVSVNAGDLVALESSKASTGQLLGTWSLVMEV